MVVTLIDFIRYLPIRLKAIWKLIEDPVLSRTYYPDEKRKSKTGVLIDLLWHLVRRQEVNQYYYYYGLDRVAANSSEYLLGYRFRKTRDRANAAMNAVATKGDTRGRGLNYRLLLGDKFVFNHYMQSLDILVPQVLALGSEKEIRWLDTDERLPLESILDRSLDTFLKVLLADGGGQVFPVKVEDRQLMVDGRQETPEKFFPKLSGQYLLQERVHQHDKLSELYPDAVNTFRLVTVFDGRSISPLAGVVRVGAMGRRWDNWSKGGLVIAVDLETGCLGRLGLRAPKYGGGCVDRHPNTGVVFEGFEVPFITEAVQCACMAHSYFYGFHSIGWDIAMTPDGPTFLEGNDDWSLEVVQGPRGPLRHRFEAMLDFNT